MKRIAGCFAAALTATLLSTTALAGQESDGKANQVPLRFIDANGKALGRAVWTSEEGVPSVVMQEAKYVFGLQLDAGGGDTTQFSFYSAPLYFESADCSGQAYIRAEYMLIGLRIAAVFIPPDQRTLIYVGAGRRKTVNVMSYGFADSSCRPYEYPQFRGDPVDAVVDVTGKFQGPFTIR